MLKILVLVGGSLNYGSYIINDFKTTYTRIWFEKWTDPKH